MMKQPAPRHHWLTAVFASLAAVVIPALIYQFLIYGRQYDARLAEAARAVTEVETEISERMGQLRSLLERRRGTGANASLRQLQEWLREAPTKDAPCGKARHWQKIRDDLATIKTASWPESMKLFLESCHKSRKPRNFPSWATVQMSGNSFVSQALAEILKTSKPNRESMAALRALPGADRIKVSYDFFPGCPQDSAPADAYRNFVVSAALPVLRVVACSDFFGTKDSEEGGRFAGYAELPFRDILEHSGVDRDFDALWLFDENGSVMARLGTGIAGNIGDVDLQGLIGTASTAIREKKEEHKNSGATDSGGAPSVSTFTEREERRLPEPGSGGSAASVLLPAFRSDVVLGGSSHEVFVQKLSLRFVDVAGAEHTLYLGAAMSSAKFRGEVMRMRITVLGLVLVALVLAVCGLPYLRIVFIGPLEEIRTSDILGLMIGVVAGAGVLTVAAFATLAYRSEREALLNRTERVATSMAGDFESDLRRSLEVLVNDADKQVREELEGDAGAAPASSALRSAAPVVEGCGTEPPPYEYSMLLDEDGKFLRLRLCRAAELVPIPIPERTYFRRVVDGRAWTIPGIRGRDRQFFVERIRTLDHGNKNTVLSLAVAPGFPYTEGPCSGSVEEWRTSIATNVDEEREGTADTARQPPRVAAMGRPFEVFWQRRMLGELAFAVVEDATGRVLYHSTDTRSLVENFFEDTSDNRALRAALASRRKANGSFVYRGESVVGAQRPLPFVPWTLVVFAEKSRAATAAFGAGVNATALFALYGLALLIALIVTRVSLPKRPWAWAWPSALRVREYVPATIAVTIIAASTTLVGLRSQGLEVLGLLLSLPVLVLSSLFLRMDPNHVAYETRHTVAKCSLFAGATVFLLSSGLHNVFLFHGWEGNAAAVLDGLSRDAWNIAVALITTIGLLVWLRGKKVKEANAGESMEAAGSKRCHRYAMCAVAVAVALGVPPATIFFADAWDQATGRLALLRARESVESMRGIDAELAREDRRVNGVRSGFDRDKAKGRQRVWRERRDGRAALEAESRRKQGARRAPMWCANSLENSEPCSDRREDGKCLKRWTKRSLQGFVGRVLPLLPIEFSQESARSRNIVLRTSGAEDGWGWMAQDRIFGWCLTDVESGEPHRAEFHGASWRKWCQSDPVGVASTGLGAVVLLIVAVLVMEPLLRRVFVLDLMRPRRQRVTKVGEGALPSGSRLILIDPPLEEMLNLDLVDTNRKDPLVISATRFLADDASARTSSVPQPGTKTFVVRDLELLLAHPIARGVLLEHLERLMEDPNATVVLTSDVFPSEWLAALDAAHGEADRAVFGTENSEPEAGDEKKKGEVAAVAKANAAARRATEILRWSDLLAKFEKRNFRGSRRAPKLKSAAWRSVDKDVRELVRKSCSWSEDLRQLAERFQPTSKITPAQMEHELTYRAAPFYRKQWNLCSSEEQLVLVQLAAGNLPNPRNLQALQSLLRRGLIKRDPEEVVLVSDSFKSFISNAESPQRLAAMRREAGNGVWAVVRVPLLLTLAMAIGFVAYVSREAIDVTVGVVGSMAALLPVLARLLTLGGGRLSSGGGEAK